MAIFTLGWSRLVIDHRLAGHFLRQFVAIQTWNIFVGAIEGIPSPRVVVELGRFPAYGVMTA